MREQVEETFIENRFGTITNKRVIYYRAKGWFRGGSREDIPLQHVTSVRLATTRSIIIGIFLLLFGIILIGSPEPGTNFIGTLFLLLAILLLIGSPSVVVNTSGNDVSAATGFPWQGGEASAFVEELRKQLFKS